MQFEYEKILKKWIDDLDLKTLKTEEDKKTFLNFLNQSVTLLIFNLVTSHVLKKEHDMLGNYHNNGLESFNKAIDKEEFPSKEENSINDCSFLFENLTDRTSNLNDYFERFWRFLNCSVRKDIDLVSVPLLIGKLDMFYIRDSFNNAVNGSKIEASIQRFLIEATVKAIEEFNELIIKREEYDDKDLASYMRARTPETPKLSELKFFSSEGIEFDLYAGTLPYENLRSWDSDKTNRFVNNFLWNYYFEYLRSSVDKERVKQHVLNLLPKEDKDKLTNKKFIFELDTSIYDLIQEEQSSKEQIFAYWFHHQPYLYRQGHQYNKDKERVNFMFREEDNMANLSYQNVIWYEICDSHLTIKDWQILNFDDAIGNSNEKEYYPDLQTNTKGNFIYWYNVSTFSERDKKDVICFMMTPLKTLDELEAQREQEKIKEKEREEYWRKVDEEKAEKEKQKLKEQEERQKQQEEKERKRKEAIEKINQIKIDEEVIQNFDIKSSNIIFDLTSKISIKDFKFEFKKIVWYYSNYKDLMYDENKHMILTEKEFFSLSKDEDIIKFYENYNSSSDNFWDALHDWWIYHSMITDQKLEDMNYADLRLLYFASHILSVNY